MILMIDLVVGIEKEINKIRKLSGVFQGAKNGFDLRVVGF